MGERLHISELEAPSCQTKLPNLKALDNTSTKILQPRYEGDFAVFYYYIQRNAEGRFCRDMSDARCIQMVAKMYARVQHLTPVTWKPTSNKSIAHNVIAFMDNGNPLLPEKFEDNVLAYTFFPNGLETKWIYFNESMDWTDGWTSRGTNGVQTGAHEIVHTLGVGHSSIRESLMFWAILRQYGRDTKDFVDYLWNVYKHFAFVPDKKDPVKPDVITPKPDDNCPRLLTSMFRAAPWAVRALPKRALVLMAKTYKLDPIGRKYQLSKRINNHLRKQ